jgi:hypothetical protein
VKLLSDEELSGEALATALGVPVDDAFLVDTPGRRLEL